MVESIPAFLQLLEKVTALLKERQTDKRQLFTDVIEPLYRECQPLAADVLNFVRELKDTVDSSDPQAIADIAQRVRKGRRQYMDVRHQFYVVLDVFRARFKNKEKIEKFLVTIGDFFGIATELGAPSRMSVLEEQVNEKLSNGMPPDLKFLSDFSRQLAHTIDSLEIKRNALALTYAETRAELILSG
jgi:hypothetical protein